jgi:hypothetical protein
METWCRKVLWTENQATFIHYVLLGELMDHSDESPCHHQPHMSNYHVARGTSITIICGRACVMTCGFMHEVSDQCKKYIDHAD